jgi:hypothetical protein
MGLVGIWRETDRVMMKGDFIIVGCPAKNQKNDISPFCTGFLQLEIETQGQCPKCGFPLGATKDKISGRWMGMAAVQ